MDHVFWVAQVVEHSPGMVEVTVWEADVLEKTMPRRDLPPIAWVDSDMPAEAALHAALHTAGLRGSEVTAHTDPVGRHSWWRGIAKGER